MNIFFLDYDITKSAQAHGDKHLRKMIVETAQMLCTAHRVIDGEMYVAFTQAHRRIKRYRLSTSLEKFLYKATHVNHPQSKWVRESVENYLYAYSLLRELCYEYTYRFGKIHKTEHDLIDILKTPPRKLDFSTLTTFICTMPDEYKISKDPVENYRNYYRLAKSKMHQWTNREKPEWS